MTDSRKATDDLAVLQQLLALHGGQLDDFHPEPPPAPIKRFLRKADLHQLQGLLVETLAAMRSRRVIPSA